MERFTGFKLLDLIEYRIKEIEEDIFKDSNKDYLTQDKELLQDYIMYLQLYNEVIQYYYPK